VPEGVPGDEAEESDNSKNVLSIAWALSSPTAGRHDDSGRPRTYSFSKRSISGSSEPESVERRNSER